MNRALVALLGALTLAGASGYLGAAALTGSAAAPDVRTVTIRAGGPTGPAGPAGPAGPRGPTGPAGAGSCPAGYELADVVFIEQGAGPTTIRTCVKGG